MQRNQDLTTNAADADSSNDASGSRGILSGLWARVRNRQGKKQAASSPGGDRMGPSANQQAWDQALEKLRQTHPEKHELVVLRFFGRYDLGEAAAKLGIDLATASEHWREARRFMGRDLKNQGIRHLQCA